MEGRKLLSGNKQVVEDKSVTLDLQSLSAGEYIIDIEGCSNAFSFKIIKQ